MIWVKRHEETGEYGLKLETCEGPNGERLKEAVYDPYDDPEHGCDWANVKPDWITDHGTVIVLLGDSPTDDTVEGDPDRDERDIKGISSYLNRRLWKIPDEMAVFVDELRTNDRANWPPSEMIAHGSAEAGRDRRTNYRRIEGAHHFIDYKANNFSRGRLGPQGTVELQDGTVIHWFLWDGSRPAVQSYAAISGYIAVLYQNELYDVSAHHSTYRSFGVSDGSVRSRLWLIIDPPVDPDGKRGVYPRTDRNSLLLKGGPHAGGPLPINDWAGEFADNMPDELVAALSAARSGMTGTLTDVQWRERLAERFGERWRLPWFRVGTGGSEGTEPEIDDPPVRKSKRTTLPTESPNSAADGTTTVRHPSLRPHVAARRIFGKRRGPESAELTSVPGGVPSYRVVPATDVPDGILAVWQSHDPEYPEGVVLINADHPVLQQVIEHWRRQYVSHHGDEIARDVIDVYGQSAVAKVAHSEHLKSILPVDTVEKDLRSDAALTMSLLGLIAEDHVIATRIGGKYTKRRSAVADPPRGG
jgi:hypothetical protein